MTCACDYDCRRVCFAVYTADKVSKVREGSTQPRRIGRGSRSSPNLPAGSSTALLPYHETSHLLAAVTQVKAGCFRAPGVTICGGAGAGVVIHYGSLVNACRSHDDVAAPSQTQGGCRA
jgi:hypothetical protein